MFRFWSDKSAGLAFKCKLCTNYNYKMLESTENTVIINYKDRSQRTEKIDEGATKVGRVSQEYSNLIKNVVESGYLENELTSFDNIVFNNKMCEKILEVKTSDDKPFACINLDCIKL